MQPDHTIFYGDGTKWQSWKGGKPPSARGVQVIVQDHDRVGVELVTGADYYVREEWGWRGVDQNGLYDYLLDSGLMLQGRMIRSEEYDEVMRQAAAEKNGWLPFERRASEP